MKEAVALEPDKPKLGPIIEHKLPDDPHAPVIVYDARGGRRRRLNEEPILTIFAGGKVVLGNPYGSNKRIETQIEKSDIQELLRFAIDKQKFFDFDAAAVKVEMQKNGRLIRILDSATSTFTIHADGKSHTASYYALYSHAKRYPKIKALTQLLAVSKELDRFQMIIRAGGEDGVTNFLKLANAKLKKEFPKARPFTKQDLASVAHYADGKRKARFYWFEGEKGKSYATASIEWPEDGPPVVSVDAKTE